jgi:hypothetical protein
MKAWARMSSNRRNGYCVQGNRTATRANVTHQCHLGFLLKSHTKSHYFL